MQSAEWILLDTETTGFTPPIVVVELAAQKMRGWEPVGEPFRKLLNQNREIPPEASRVHGYTREILERDGEPAIEVYAAFARYAGGLPLVAYNLEYDLEQVLMPEWKRLNIATPAPAGFCALRLAQRLLDPVPAGNCKLQTLRQYYRMPERGAHTGLGDVMTVADLCANVLRPIATLRGLNTWEAVVRYAGEEWYPSRISFGKFKGRSIFEARTSPEIHQWLDWLTASKNARSSRMGRWYLRELESGAGEESATVAAVADSSTGEAASAVPALILYVRPDLRRLRDLVAGTRARLAELEAAYTSEKANVSALQAKLFKQLRPHFEKRDRVRLVVRYRQTFLDTLLREGEEEAAKAQDEYRKADANAQKEYTDTARTMADRRELSPDEESELKALWKQLVKLFHPDRYANDPERLKTYHNLTAAINAAKDNGDLETLRRIAENPAAYVLRQGWTAIDFGDTDELDQLQRLLASLELEVLAVIEATDDLKASPDYELCQIVGRKPEIFETVVQQQVTALDGEISTLEATAAKLETEIAELTGKGSEITL